MPAFTLRGTFTALVTPFTEGDGSIDFPAYERLLEAQIAGKIDGLVPCGTTGESPTLSEPEKFELIQRTVRSMYMLVVTHAYRHAVGASSRG